MRDARSFPEIYLYKKSVDMRKSINGLSQIVVDEMKHNPCDGGLFGTSSPNRALKKSA